MKKISVSIIIYFFLSISSFSHINHYNQFNYLEYELFRNNKLIGDHKFNFIRDGEKLTVKSEVNFRIKKLNVVLYNYHAVSEEIYKDSIFFSFKSKTKQNKKDKYVNVTVDDDNSKLLINGSSYKGPTSLKSIMGTWWNHEIIQSSSQISAISGRVIEQTVTFIGKEDIFINDKEYKSLRFNIKSSDESLPDKKKLNTDIWYEEKTNLWLKASFDKTGYWEYRVKNY